MRYKAILFDLDGTLLDSVPVILRAFRETMESMGLPFDEAATRRSLGIPLAVQGPVFAGEKAAEFMERYRGIYRAYQSENAQLFPHTVDMLKAVRSGGILTALVTSKRSHAVASVTQQTGIADWFDCVVAADDVAQPKPHPEPIIRALELLEVRREDALYVGDAVFDAEASRAAGIAVVGVSWGARSKQDLLEHCDAVIDSWPELLDWLGISVRSTAFGAPAVHKD